MEGQIAVESTLGAGATFTVTLPLRAATKERDAGLAAPDLGGHAVLVAAQTPMEAMLLARRLDRWRAETHVVHNVPEALTQLSARRFDTLLVDFPLAASLAGQSAMSAARRIVLIKPAERHELPALRQAGFTGYLVKPVRAASLAARLRSSDAFESMTDPVEAETPAAAAGGKGLSILVAEDNDINALLTQALLARLGHRPVVVSDGEAAVDAWQSARMEAKRYDLILMDIQMPGMDGLEAARRIRAAEAGDERPTPILALSANAQAEDREAALAAGMGGLLTKPLDRERLRDALDAIQRGFTTLAA
jgi:CheY-like chemotaxis protein